MGGQTAMNTFLKELGVNSSVVYVTIVDILFLYPPSEKKKNMLLLLSPSNFFTTSVAFTEAILLIVVIGERVFTTIIKG